MPPEAAEPSPDVVGRSGVLLAGRLLASAVSYLSLVAVARSLGADDFGALTFVQALGSLVASIFDFQVGRRVLVDLQRDDVDIERTMADFVTLRMALGTGAGLVCVAVAALGSYPSEVVWASVVMIPVIVLGSAWNGLFVYFQYRLWLTSVAITLVVTRVVTAALLLALVASDVGSIAAYIGVTVFLEGATFLALVIICRKELRFRLHVDLARWRYWFREAIPIAFGAAIGLVYYRLDIVMLSLLDDLKATGLYGVAYKFTDLVGFVPASLMAATFPLLVRSWPDDTEGFGANVRGAAVLLTTIGAVLIGAFSVYAEDVVLLLYGHRFQDAATASVLVVGGEGLRFLTTVCVQTLIAVGRNRAYAAAAVAGLVANILINLVLIPALSFNGAAIATVVTEGLVLAVLVPLVVRLPGVRAPIGPVVRIAGAVAAQVAVGLVLRDRVPWPIGAGAGVAAFFVTLHLGGLDGPGGLRVVRHLVRVRSAD